jgi:hypothetical protein
VSNVSDPTNASDPKPSRARVVLKPGTVILVEGAQAELCGDTEVETASHDLLVKHTAFVEYPKVVTIDGVTFEAKSAAHEAELRAQAAAAAAEALKPASSLEDVEVEMDNPDFDKPRGKAAKKK